MFENSKEGINRCVEDTGILKLSTPKTHPANIWILTFTLSCFSQTMPEHYLQNIGMTIHHV